MQATANVTEEQSPLELSGREAMRGELVGGVIGGGRQAGQRPSQVVPFVVIGGVECSHLWRGSVQPPLVA